MVPCRPWRWTTLLVEFSKPLVGVTYGLMSFAQSIASMADGIHGDLVAHHNYLITQEHMRSEMALALETL